MEKRLGTISIIAHRDSATPEKVNALLSEHAHLILGRLGLPYPDRGINIITLVIDATVEEVSALNGKLGRLSGIQVRSLMTRPPHTEESAHDHS